jgi:hypothetical protein
MTSEELHSSTGISTIRTISPTTKVVEFTSGGVRPATAVEETLWGLLTRLTDG